MAGKLPRRSTRFGIGKDIGGAVYVHRRYEAKLGRKVTEAKEKIPTGFGYQVVKYNYRTQAVSFIQSSDFDVALEPTVGDMIIVNREGRTRRRRQPSDPEIYHHKWMFVADDYEGFDVEQSKRRSLAWLALEDVDRTRIGRKSYWQRHVAPRLEG